MIFVEMTFNFKKHKSELLGIISLKRSELFITEVNNKLPNFVRIIDVFRLKKKCAIFTIMIKTTPDCMLNPKCSIEYCVQLVKDNLISSNTIPEDHTYTFRECTIRILKYENMTKLLECSPDVKILEGNKYSVLYEDMVNAFPLFPVVSPIIHNSPNIEICKEEYDIFGGESYENELKRISSMEKSDYRIYNNTCYKMLIRNVKYIPHMIEPLIDKLYDKGLIMSKAYTAINVIRLLKELHLTNQNQYMIKSVIQGGTVVLYVDFPNLLFNNFVEEKDQNSDHYVKGASKNEEVGDSEEDNEPQKLRLEFFEKLLDKYSLSNWCYNCESFNTFAHLSTSSIVFDKFNKNNDFEKLETSLRNLIKLICDNYKYCNIIIAYTDTVAYSKNTFLEFLIEFLTKLNVEIKELSNTTVLQKEEDVDKLIKRIMCETFGLTSLSDETTGIYGKMYREIKEVVFKKIKENDNTDFLLTSSIVSFNVFILELCETYLSNNTNITDGVIDIDTEETNINTDTEINKPILSAEDCTNPILSLLESFSTARDMYPTFKFTTNHYKICADVKDAKEKLNRMIGLVEIKRQIKEFASLVRINDIRKKQGLHPMEISKHMIFAGNPGTAKTTVASLLANILYEDDVIKEKNISILSKDKLEEKYVGWTAKNVAKAIEGAKGGILFVDEAYALVNKGYKGYGQEVIDTFVNYMDKKEVRENTIIIFAGYKKEMETFINTNPGIKSRVGFILDFPDYTVDELVDIAKVQAKEKGITLSPEYVTKLGSVIKDYYKDKNFGNGRFVRNVLEKSILKQSIRLVKESEDDKLDIERLNTLLEEDLSTDGLKKIDSCKIGFNS